MKSFFKEFLRDEPPPAGAGPQVCLGAFGKHPGWDDHMDDLGLETESLLLAKHLLYVQGIGGQLNAGAWERLDATTRLPAVHHEFIWARERQVLVGRLWPSSDGKRRTLYPMAVCAHVFGLSPETCIASLLPLLDPIEARCRRAKSSEDVRAIILEAHGQYMASAGGGAATEPGPLQGTLPEQFVKGALPLVLANVRRLLAPYWRGEFRERSKPATVTVRVPSVAGFGIGDLIFWNRFFSSLLDAEAPVLFLKPVAQPWLDVVLGEPATGDLFALRAAPPVVPVLGESGGQPDENAQQEAVTLCEAILHPEPAAPPGRPWLKKIFG